MRFNKSRTAVVVKTSGAVITTSQSERFIVGTGDDVVVMIDCTIVTGTSPSMTVSVQWSNDGTTWYTSDPAENFTALTTTGKVTKVFTVKGKWARLNYLISGTSPSFTFAAHAVVGD